MGKGFWLCALVVIFTVAPGAMQSTSASPSSNTNSPFGAKDAGSPATADQRGGATGKSDGLVAGTPLQADNAETGISSGELQSQVQNALNREPTLANDHLNLSVSNDQIELSGTVTTAKEKLAAQRIVQSYAGNRKVKDQVKVSGHSHAASQ